MAGEAAPFTEKLKIASASLDEGRAVLADIPDPRSEGSKFEAAYGWQALVSGFIQLEAMAKRYTAMPDVGQLHRSPKRLVLEDPAFGSAAEECAVALEQADKFMGGAGKRMAGALRRLVAEGTVNHAHLLAGQADAIARTLKMKVAH
jgi:hypothetical protein